MNGIARKKREVKLGAKADSFIIQRRNEIPSFRNIGRSNRVGGSWSISTESLSNIENTRWIGGDLARCTVSDLNDLIFTKKGCT